MNLWLSDIFYLLINVDLFFWTFVKQLIFLQRSLSFSFWSLLLGEIRIIDILILLNLSIWIINRSICIVNTNLFICQVAIFYWIYLEFWWFFNLFLRSSKLYRRLIWFWFIFLYDLAIKGIVSIIWIIFNFLWYFFWDYLCQPCWDIVIIIFFLLPIF